MSSEPPLSIVDHDRAAAARVLKRGYGLSNPIPLFDDNPLRRPKMNHELALRERWLRIAEAAREYEEQELAEATIVLPALMPKTPAFKQPKGHD